MAEHNSYVFPTLFFRAVIIYARKSDFVVVEYGQNKIYIKMLLFYVLVPADLIALFIFG